MKKLIRTIFICAIFTALLCSAAFAMDDISVYLDGQKIEFDVPPIQVDGRTLVPMRAIFEAMGAVVGYDEESNTVNAYSPGVSIELPIGENTVYRNTISQDIDVPAQIVDGRTLVPLRLVSEYMGADVEWNEENRSVYISSTDKIKRLYWNDTYYYYGENVDGIAQGYGMLLNIATDDLYYVGTFDIDMFKEGTVLYDDGDYYQGTFANGKYDGYGEYYWANGDYHIGNFVDGERNGYGESYYASGDYYIGNFVDDKKNGQGEYHWADGDYYIGNWADGKQNGYGESYYADGGYYKGDYVNNNRHGYGTAYIAETKLIYYGEYFDGKRDGKFLVHDLQTGREYYVYFSKGTFIGY